VYSSVYYDNRKWESSMSSVISSIVISGDVGF